MSAIDPFEAARPRLHSLAYRMLGVVADADDVVQQAWLRWHAADRDGIVNPDAWLTTATTRLAIDRLRRRRREQAGYVGPWLPEPLVERGPEHAAELADSLTLGFLIMLERLSPAERAALLLADVFGEPFSIVAATLDRSEAACRQLASRARAKCADAAAEVSTSVAGRAQREVVDRFVAALASGDEATALGCLHPDVDLVSDGGATRRAARRPIVGRERVLRFLASLSSRAAEGWTVEPARVGGLPGLVAVGPGGDVTVVGFDVVDGRIGAVRIVRNPAKLTALTR